jgi:hypothetical protein
MTSSLGEKRKTAQTTKSKDQGGILEARVIANYGDPGLAEDYQFDICSRYVIVMIESVYRIPTLDRWPQLFAVVQRPRHLWINHEGFIGEDRSRSDANGNVSVGMAANFSVNGIPPLNQTYTMGEIIKIKKLSIPYTASANPSFFQSIDTSLTSSAYYNAWHTEGSTQPYIQNLPWASSMRLKRKTLNSVEGANPDYLYDFYLDKVQYEAFMLTISDADYIENLTRVFQGEWNSGTPVYSHHGGYVFGPGNTDGYLLISSCQYEDINIGNKQRTGGNECIPLVVTTPNSFPTPKTRAVGTIAYNPSYSPIAR